MQVGSLIGWLTAQGRWFATLSVGLWLWGDADGGLWSAGHAGLILVGAGCLDVVGAARGLGAGLGREPELTAVFAGASGLYLGAVWLLGGGGRPAFVGSIVLFLAAAVTLVGGRRGGGPHTRPAESAPAEPSAGT